MQEVLKVKGISKSYGKHQILEEVNLSVEKGEVFGLLGPNAAGKSTLTKIMTFFLKADKGNIKYFFGEKKGKTGIMKLIAVVPQEESFYRGFSVQENISFFASLYGIKKNEAKKRADFLIKWLNLEKFKDKRAEHLSGGYRRMLNIACSLIHNPEIIFMDEPTVGLDPAIRKLLWEKILQLKQKGKTIVLTTHYMDEAEELCDRIGMILDGKILAVDNPKKLIQKLIGTKVFNYSLKKEPKKQLLELIQKALPESEMVSEGKKLSVFVSKKDSKTKIEKITAKIIASGNEVLGKQEKVPDLEDVFLKLVGGERGALSAKAL